MTRTLIISTFFLILGQLVTAQSIERNETDEFTGTKYIETDWGVLYMKMGSSIQYRIRVIDNQQYLHVKAYTGYSLKSVYERHPLMLKLENDSVVKLSPSETTTGCYGCASLDGFIGSKAAGVSVHYNLSDDVINDLVRFGVTKSRLYTDDGYFEETINTKKAIQFRDYFRLLWPRGIEPR